MNSAVYPLAVFFAAVFTNNILLSNYLGMCSFLSVSRELKTSLGLGAAVTFVMAVTSLLNWLVYHYLLIPLDLEYLRFIVFIMVIAAFVQLVEMKLPNFTFVPALSEPKPEDNWEGETGLITDIVTRNLFSGENVEAYLCGSPGVITLHGFLGTDTRNLVDILIDDDAKTKRMGLSHERISRRMEVLRKSGLRVLGEFISIEPHFEVKVDTVRGKLPCPFGHPGIFPKINTTVRNLHIKREITYTDLNIHLIGAHGFYEGKGSPFRIEPRNLVEVLEIEAEE